MSIRQVGLEFYTKGEQDAFSKLKTFKHLHDETSGSIKRGMAAAAGMERDVKKLTDAFSRGTLTEKAYNDAMRSLAREYKKLNEGVRGTEISIQKATAAVRGVAKAHRDQAAAAAAAAVRQEELNASKQRAAFVLAMQKQKMDEEVAAQRQADAEAKRHEQTLERLRHKFIQGHSAMDLYSKEMNDLAMARRADIITAEEQALAVDMLNKEYQEFTSGAATANNRFAAHTNQASRRLNQFGVVTQQAGYQVGDFLVQVQSGTNPMVAFGQQATQLVGTFAMLSRTTKGIAIFSGLGIALPLLTAVGAYLMRTGEAAKEAADGIQSLEDRVKSLDNTVQDWLRTKKAASMGITVEELTGVENIEAAQAKVNALREEVAAQVRAQEAASLLGGGTLMGTFFGVSDESGSSLTQLEAALIEAERKLRVLRAKQRQEAREESEAEMNATWAEQQRERALAEYEAGQAEIAARQEWQEEAIQIFRAAQQRMRDEREQNARLAAQVSVGPSQTDLNTTNQYVSAMAEAFDNARNLREQLGDGAYEALRLAGVDMTKGVDAAAQAAARLAAKLGVSLGHAMNIMTLGQDVQAGMVRRGIASGAIPPQAAADLPQTEGERAYENLLADRRAAARRAEAAATRASGGGRGGGSSRETATESQFLAALEAELAVKRKMIGASEQERAILERVNELQDQAIQKDLNISESRLRQFAEEELAIQRQLDMQATFTNNIERAMMSVVDGTASVEDAFKSMLRNIIMAIYQQQVAEPIASSIGGWISKLFGSANGNVFAGGGHVTAYANGGVVNGPTFFPMTGNKTGLMGEAGPEAIMPLTRTKNGKLGVVAEGGGGVVVNNHFNIAANGDASVKQIVKGMMPQITAATKSAVADAKRRGGNYGKAFN